MTGCQLFHFMQIQGLNHQLYIVLPIECTVEEKEPYEAKAREDKKRYKDEISGYKNPQPMNIDSGNESDSA